MEEKLMLRSNTQEGLHLSWQGRLSDYVTAIAWFPDSTRLAACSAAGEVVLYDAKTGLPQVLQPAQGQSVNALAISHDGKLLAAAGQSGTVEIWQIEEESVQSLTQLTYPNIWIDRLQWNPVRPELALSFSRYVQVWEAQSQTIVTTLNFANSSVLDLAWHPQGEHLAVGGNQGIKTWHRQHWDEAPTLRETAGASVAIAWSLDGFYLASGNNDRSLLVWQEDNPYPWRMQGFPGKVRQLAWSSAGSKTNPPLLASISLDTIVMWRKAADFWVGWTAQVLEHHQATVRAIAFQPGSHCLASAADDGQVCLWQRANRRVQTLQGAPNGFSALAWNRPGTVLATAGQQGELLLWERPGPERLSQNQVSSPMSQLDRC